MESTLSSAAIRDISAQGIFFGALAEYPWTCLKIRDRSLREPSGKLRIRSRHASMLAVVASTCKLLSAKA